jgi:hypothetical protein
MRGLLPGPQLSEVLSGSKHPLKQDCRPGPEAALLPHPDECFISEIITNGLRAFLTSWSETATGIRRTRIHEHFAHSNFPASRKVAIANPECLPGVHTTPLQSGWLENCSCRQSQSIQLVHSRGRPDSPQVPQASLSASAKAGPLQTDGPQLVSRDQQMAGYGLIDRRFLERVRPPVRGLCRICQILRTANIAWYSALARLTTLSFGRR